MTVVLTEGDLLTGADAAFADLLAVERLRVVIKSSSELHYKNTLGVPP